MKVTKVIDIIFTVIVLVLFVYSLHMFATTKDLTHGIWALLFMITMASKPTKDERK